MKHPEPLIIDTSLKQTRLEQVYLWVEKIVNKGDRPTKLPMTAARTALTRRQRAILLERIRNQLGEKYNFTAQWSGQRNGSLWLRIDWQNK